MPHCLVCRSNPIADAHVMCNSCYRQHEEIIRDLRDAPLPALELRRKLWGQQFDKNRTPANRARIAYAAYLLAAQGDGEHLVEVRRAFLAPGQLPPRQSDLPGPELIASEAEAISELDRILAHGVSPTDTPGNLRTKDGHWVRSKSEREIADFLFENRIAYQYERRVTIGGVDLHPDFYMPDVADGTYLEHFGLLHEDRYRRFAERKVALYKEAGFALVVTDEKDALDFDSALHRKLSPLIPKLNQR